ncbi:MAG TPA: hypothetical protein VNN10_14185 [Dehalococcoidia bacterium]|nr:hypothetical protein [Dehalococcoidia bacterium]
MGHVLFITVVLVICVAWWAAVYAAPWTLSLLLPAGKLIFMIGFAVFAFGLGSAALTAYSIARPEDFVGSLLFAFWGGWLMLAPTAARRSSPEDREMMERLGVMLVALMCVLVLSFYAPPEAIAGLQLWLVLFGGAVATRGLARRER